MKEVSHILHLNKYLQWNFEHSETKKITKNEKN